jgi:hypothetical protein
MTDGATVDVAFKRNGYLILDAQLATELFPSDSIIAVPRDGELWIMPVSARASGGLLLKQRNARGDRSVMVWHVMPGEACPEGNRPARWDAQRAALRIAL